MREAGPSPTLIVFSTAVGLFLVIAFAIALSAPLAALDASAGRWLHVRATPLVSYAMAVVSFLGAPTTLTIVAVGGSLLLLYRRRRTEAATLSTVVLGGNLLNFCLKHLIQRGRPHDARQRPAKLAGTQRNPQLRRVRDRPRRALAVDQRRFGRDRGWQRGRQRHGRKRGCSLAGGRRG